MSETQGSVLKNTVAYFECLYAGVCTLGKLLRWILVVDIWGFHLPNTKCQDYK